MPRARLSVDDVLSTIKTNCGRDAFRTARRLVRLAEDIGAQPRPRTKAVALRMPGPVDAKPDWLTLLVLSNAGTVYNNWHGRWPVAGVPARAASEYERRLTSALGENFITHPSAYRAAVPLRDVENQWSVVEGTLRKAAGEIQRAVSLRSPSKRKAIASGAAALRVLEGQLTETRVARRKRSASLRKNALALSDGRCTACGSDFGSLLGGRGWRVLQVHHREQLAASDVPRWNSVDDLDVVCANCHLLIHSDPTSALSVQTLRAQLKNSDSHA